MKRRIYYLTKIFGKLKTSLHALKLQIDVAAAHTTLLIYNDEAQTNMAAAIGKKKAIVLFSPLFTACNNTCKFIVLLHILGCTLGRRLWGRLSRVGVCLSQSCHLSLIPRQMKSAASGGRFTILPPLFFLCALCSYPYSTWTLIHLPYSHFRDSGLTGLRHVSTGQFPGLLPGWRIAFPHVGPPSLLPPWLWGIGNSRWDFINSALLQTTAVVRIKKKWSVGLLLFGI